MSITLICKHCNYVWDYTGEQSYYACCPVCRYKVNINSTFDFKEYEKQCQKN